MNTLVVILIVILIVLFISMIAKGKSIRNVVRNWDKYLIRGPFAQYDDTTDAADQDNNTVEPTMENTKSEVCYESAEDDMFDDMIDETKRFAGMERCDLEKGECSSCSMKYTSDPDVLRSLNETTVPTVRCIVDRIDRENEAYVKNLKE